MKLRTLLLLFLSATLAVGATGCLKSRLQLREEEKDTGQKGVHTQVQEVAPQAGAVDELKTEITRMTGRVEEIERGRKEILQAAAQAQKEELRKIETRIVELEQAQMQMLEAIKKMQQEPRRESVKPASTENGESFEKAKAQFDAQNFDAAIEAFSGYLKNSKSARLEDATFFRGESHFELKQYKKAIVDYSRFPEKFTRSKRMPAALLRIGQSFDALGMKEDAKGFYQELVEKFPKSSEAKKARAKLK